MHRPRGAAGAGAFVRTFASGPAAHARRFLGPAATLSPQAPTITAGPTAGALASPSSRRRLASMECCMRTSNFGERKLTELDFIRLKKFTAAGAMPQLADLLNEAEVVPAYAMPPDVVTMDAQFAIRHLKMDHCQHLVVCDPSDA